MQSVSTSDAKMSMTYRYRAYGLNILSEIEMPHWLPGEGPWDVRIQWGDVPFELPEATCIRNVFWGREDSCLLNDPEVGRMMIESGKTITLALAAEGAAGSLATLIASTGMAALAYQRGKMCLHASAVAKDDRAVLFMGLSGAGKSTLASAMIERGHALLSDDITVIRERANGSFEAIGSFPSIRLHRDSLETLSSVSHSSPGIDPLDEKSRIRPRREFALKPVEIARICLLETGSVSALEWEPITGIERVTIIQQNFFRPRVARTIGDHQRLLKMSMAMARTIEMQRIVRPASGFYLDELCAAAIQLPIPSSGDSMLSTWTPR